MTSQLRKVSGFEIRSVMLFAAISLGSVAAMAQAPSTAPQPTFGGGSAAGVQSAPAPAAPAGAPTRCKPHSTAPTPTGTAS